MILSLGIGGWVAGLFHLITHACFKALLFLGSGSVIHGCGGEQDIRKMGGLHRKMPITSITFLIATMAISGVPLLSGAYSKDAMLASMLGFVWTHPAHWLLFLLPAMAAAITAFYMMRLYLLTFHTSARDEHIYSHAHESPKVMWIPLAVLAALTIGIGWFGQTPRRTPVGEGQYTYSGGSGLEGLIADAQPRWAVSWQMSEISAPSHGAVAHAATGEQQQDPGHEGLHTAATIIATSAMVLGFLLAGLVYGWGLVSAERTAARFRTVYRLLVNKFYFDEIYGAVFVAGVLRLAAFGRWCDRRVLDGIADGSARWVVRAAHFSGMTLDDKGVDGAVNGTAGLTVAAGNMVRKGQTGRIRNYLLAMATLVAGVIFYIGVYHWV
jgi:NADH-quinone oxidoreductase subunit L